MSNAGSELFASAAVDDEVDRAVEDGTKPGSHVQVDVPGEDVVCLSLLKAGDDTVDPIIIELIG